MIALLIGVAILFLILSWLMWVPMRLCVDTIHDRYFLSFGGLFHVTPHYGKGDIFLTIKVPWYSFSVYPFQASKSKAKSKRELNKEGKTTKNRFTLFEMRALLNLIRTFSMKQLYVNVDTGDNVLNAKLTPVLFLLSRGPVQLQTNYRGYTHVWIEIENRLIRFFPTVFRYMKRKYL